MKIHVTVPFFVFILFFVRLLVYMLIYVTIIWNVHEYCRCEKNYGVFISLLFTVCWRRFDNFSHTGGGDVP